MKKLLFVISLFQASLTLYAQCDPYIESVVNDIEEQINVNKAYQINFQLELSYVGETPQLQKGVITVSENKFRLQLPDQTYISDGQNLWILFQEEKELQIMGLEDGLGTANLSPIQVLLHYCSEDYLSRNLGKTMEDEREVEHLEFSPHDKSDDMFKVRISYDSAKKEIYRVKSFNKDGSRMILTAGSYNFSPRVNDDTFVCDEKEYSDYHIEDLR